VGRPRAVVVGASRIHYQFIRHESQNLVDLACERLVVVVDLDVVLEEKWWCKRFWRSMQEGSVCNWHCAVE